MSYTINLTNGTTLTTVSDGTIDTSHSSLTLIGRNYAGYGDFLNENLIYMLENFANGTGPANPLRGQLWWDTINNILRVWSGSTWKISTGATSSPASAPPADLSSLGGDLWFDTTNQQLKVFSGTGWIVVGPAVTPATGDTGVVPAIMSDTSLGSHIVVQFKISGVVYAILSKDTFASSLAGFSSVVSGLNFSTIASPSLGLNTQSVSATPNSLVVRDGSSGISATAVSATTVSATTISTQSITSSSGYTGTILTASQPNITSVGTLSGLTVSAPIIPSANSSVNLGSPSAWFGTIYGTSSHSQYADLAERYEADSEYEPGTVVELGGSAEITKVVADLSEKVFGVISTNAAYLMNDTAGTNATHPPVALTGRVPVKVTGKVNKGDRLVSAGNGFARVGRANEITPWNVIGRALVDKHTDVEGIIEAIVKIS